MPDDSRHDLKSKLDELKRRAQGVFGIGGEAFKPLSAPPPVPRAPAVEEPGIPVTDEQLFTEPPPGPLELLVGGEVTEAEGEKFYRVRHAASSIWERGAATHAGYLETLASPPVPLPGGCSPFEALIKAPPRSIIFLDIETTGLRSAPLFLIGLMYSEGEELILDQLFARDYTEERAVLSFVSRMLEQFEVLVTFNGLTFDVPFMAERAVYFGLQFRTPPSHVDLLPVSRGVLRGRTPNHRLQTLERYVLGRRRTGDIPGSEIPGAYHEFVRTGDASRMAAVIHHNRLDLLSMLELVTVYLTQA